ncbi:hypothetical protein JHK82_043786 [Glycine max]|uniref:Cysteine-rich transmembrane CYSTM domain-containing protein n=2 Tax=Glycine subgen. Soja TaxID=1462606 RepID=A0A0R0G606_SOYBN|nr:hypothetical protein JHK85_044331 [Glycine max]KAG5106816.1 hypothetical protein JHK82_043786 [Glycine max]KAG5117741.1 hypothetical protein JHK84_043854 [Glycine max]KAH1148828.1 hypothetical protein GYH30_043456 [Glycine max]RZB66251.1 hypothetical protein D0Y65_042046 [Glycine soja]
MSHFNIEQEAPEVSYPSSVEAYRPAPYATAPPPIGYPSKDGPAAAGYPQQRVPEETKTRGCAALCCCCVLDCCF